MNSRSGTTSSSRTAMLVVIAFALCTSASTGCARRAGEIFPPLERPIVWPAPPEPPRVRYVGQLVTSGDLRPGTNFAQGIGEALFGRRPVRSMLTPYALCTDGEDRLFVADSNAQLVHVFDLRRRSYQQIVPANELRRFAQPVGIAHDEAQGRLYVSDSADPCIYVFDRTGQTIGRIRGDFLQRPCGLAYDPKRRLLFVADASLHQVLVLSHDGHLVARLGQRGAAPGHFNFPTNVALDSAGRLYVSDSLNFRVQQFGADLAFLRIIGQKGDMPGYFSQPKGLALDSRDHLYVVDANFEAVQVFDQQGRLLLSFGQEGRGPGEFWLPAGIYIDPSDRIWIADSYNRRIAVLEYLTEVPP
jgi:DNA-binding beta-propeller fold protein YncE